jgi:lysophospholipase L1-like esterase
MAKKLKVIFFGDSICFGQGVATHLGWVPRLSQDLHQLAESLAFDLDVSNPSVCGSTTRQALERISFDLQSHRPDMVVVQFGLNDCNIWETDLGLSRVSPRAFEANLHEIIDRAIRFSARKVFLHTNHPTMRRQSLLPNSNVAYEQQNACYNQIVRDVAQCHSAVQLNDIEEAVKAWTKGDLALTARLVLADGLHLSREGHDFYFRTVRPALMESLGQLMEVIE